MNNKVLYEDEFVIAVDKFPGEIVIKDRFGREPEENILIYKVSNYLRGQGHTADAEGKDLFPLHRLDRETSGIVLFAKNREAHKLFSKLFASKQLSKTYWFFSCLDPDWDEARLELPLKKAEGKRGRGRSLINIKEGGEAITSFFVRERFDSVTWIEAIPETGKLHQIRVHANVLGVPLMNDKLYGEGEEQSVEIAGSSIKRFPLHARYLEFVHPIKNEVLKISSALPADMRNLLNILKSNKKRTR